MKKTGKKIEKRTEELQPVVVASDKVAKAVLKWVRISPRKVRPVLDVIRKKPVRFAWMVLGTIPKKAARFAEKALKSAIANAKVLEMDEERLYISDARADGGPTLKRFLPRSMGRADRILKRTTHLTLVVKEGANKTRLSSTESPSHEHEEGGAKASKKKITRKKKAAAAGSK